jgi:hypothetical protein
MKCWTCGKEVTLPNFGKISFRAVCEYCHAALHCCLNCKHYKPGRPNDCELPGTDYIADRSANNFCDEYNMLGKGPEPKKENDKSKFDDLFKI